MLDSKETQAEEERKIARTIEELPKLKEGYIRLVHLSYSPRALEQIPQTGLNYEKYGMVMSTARAYSKEEQVEYGSEDSRFKGAPFVFVFDLPAEEHKIHENPTKAPGVIPPKYLVGIIYKR